MEVGKRWHVNFSSVKMIYNFLYCLNCRRKISNNVRHHVSLILVYSWPVIYAHFVFFFLFSILKSKLNNKFSYNFHAGMVVKKT